MCLLYFPEYDGITYIGIVKHISDTLKTIVHFVMDLYLIDHLYSQSDQPSKVVLSTIRQLVSYTEVQYERSKIIQST